MSDDATTKAKGGKPRTGTLVPCRDANGRRYWAGRIRLADKSKHRIEVPEGKRYDECAARHYVEWAQEREDATKAHYLAKLEAAAARAAATTTATPAPAAEPEGETCDEWYSRYHAYAKEIGQTDADKKRSRWGKWIRPRIGHKRPEDVTRDDVEDIRDALDRAIHAWTQSGGRNNGQEGDASSGKTAMNAWSCLTSAFKAMASSKRRDLRVLDGKSNPCTGVEPPGDKDSRKARRKTFLFPKEATALLGCEAIPLEWREVYAVALYTYLRPGELRVLTWGDVDLDARHINVTKAWDYADEKIKPPKTRNGVRRVPIDPNLAPLLDRMGKGKEPTALVVPRLSAFGEDHLAEQFRRHLTRAKVTRAELHETTRTHVQANFRSCRDSGITWLAMTGLDVAKIMRRAGHDEIQTTMGYVKLAEDLTGELGAPFGPLPLLVDRVALDHFVDHPTLDASDLSVTIVPEEGVEPPT